MKELKTRPIASNGGRVLSIRSCHVTRQFTAFVRGPLCYGRGLGVVGGNGLAVAARGAVDGACVWRFGLRCHRLRAFGNDAQPKPTLSAMDSALDGHFHLGDDVGFGRVFFDRPARCSV